MLPSIHDYLWYQFIPSRDIVDQGILQSDWTCNTPSHIQPKAVVSEIIFTWWSASCRKIKISLDKFQKHWGSKNPAIWLDKRHIWVHLIISGGAKYYLPLMVTPCKKTKTSLNYFERCLWPKNPAIWSEERYNWSHPTKSKDLRFYLQLKVIHMQKI